MDFFDFGFLDFWFFGNSIDSCICEQGKIQQIEAPKIQQSKNQQKLQKSKKSELKNCKITKVPVKDVIEQKGHTIEDSEFEMNSLGTKSTLGPSAREGVFLMF